MKNRITMITILVLVILTSSCEKDYSCSCKEVDTSTSATKNSYTLKKSFLQKSEASSWCSGMNENYFGIKRECNIK